MHCLETDIQKLKIFNWKAQALTAGSCKFQAIKFVENKKKILDGMMAMSTPAASFFQFHFIKHRLQIRNSVTLKLFENWKMSRYYTTANQAFLCHHFT